MEIQQDQSRRVPLKDNLSIYRFDAIAEQKKEAEAAALDMLEHSIHSEKTIDYLVEKGYSNSEAEVTVSRLNRIRKKLREKKALRKVIKGLFYVVVGCAIGYFLSESPAFEPVTVISALLVGFGAIQFIKGISLNHPQ